MGRVITSDLVHVAGHSPACLPYLVANNSEGIHHGFATCLYKFCTILSPTFRFVLFFSKAFSCFVLYSRASCLFRGSELFHHLVSLSRVVPQIALNVCAESILKLFRKHVKAF